MLTECLICLNKWPNNREVKTSQNVLKFLDSQIKRRRLKKQTKEGSFSVTCCCLLLDSSCGKMSWVGCCSLLLCLLQCCRYLETNDDLGGLQTILCKPLWERQMRTSLSSLHRSSHREPRPRLNRSTNVCSFILLSRFPLPSPKQLPRCTLGVMWSQFRPQSPWAQPAGAQRWNSSVRRVGVGAVQSAEFLQQEHLVLLPTLQTAEVCRSSSLRHAAPWQERRHAGEQVPQKGEDPICS